MNESLKITKIKVFGVGDRGNNAVNRMIEEGINGAEFYAVNTDLQALNVSKAINKIQIGAGIAEEKGANSSLEVGRKSALENKKEIEEAVKGADMVFVVSGLGGGTGTGAAPVIAEIAQEAGALTIAIVTKPFRFEGEERMKHALVGLEELKKHVDTLIIVPTDSLRDVTDNLTADKEMFKEVDNILYHDVRSISDLINVTGIVNIDFDDIKNVMEKSGTALIGIGMGIGDNRATEAARQAILNASFETTLDGATDAIINITGDDSLNLREIEEVVKTIRDAAGSDIRVIFGAIQNANLTKEVIVTVILMGFEK